MPKKPTIKASNAEILTTVGEHIGGTLGEELRNIQASEVDYQRAYAAINSTPETRNEFINTLMNVIGQTYVRTARKWRNPLKEFMKENLLFGDTLEEIAIDTYQSHNYKVSGTPGDAFAQEKPDVLAMFHKRNFEKYWETTFNDKIIRKALLNENGLARFVETQTTQLYNSAELAEYEAMRDTIVDQYKFGNVRAIKIDDPATQPKSLVKAVRENALRMTFLGTNYNTAELHTFTPMEDLYLLITPDVEAEQTVEVLASAFNMDKADFVGKVKLVDAFGETGIKAALVDKEAFMFLPYLFEVHGIYDPRHLVYNMYLHDHATFSFSQFVNAIIFTTDDVNKAEVTEITFQNTPYTVQRGQTMRVEVTIVGASVTGNGGAYFELTGNTSNDTYISDAGVVYCGADEAIGTKLLVTAYAMENTDVKASVEVAVNS